MIGFRTEENAIKYAKLADITKEYYICPVEEIGNLLRKEFV